MLHNDFYPRELYPDDADNLRFEFLASLFRTRNKSIVKQYEYQMGIVITKYPYIARLFNAFDAVFDNQAPFDFKDKATDGS